MVENDYSSYFDFQVWSKDKQKSQTLCKLNIVKVLSLALHAKQKKKKNLGSQRGQFFQNLQRCKRTAKLSKSVNLGAEFYKCPKFIGKTTRIMA